MAAMIREAQVSGSQIVPANGPAQIQIVTDRIGYFIAEKSSAQFTDPRFRTAISDDGSGSQFNWFSSQVPKGVQPGKTDLANFWGTSEYPHNFVTPVPMGPFTTILVDLDDYSGAPNDVETVLEGYYYIEEDPANPGRYLPPPQFRKAQPDHFFGYVFTAPLNASDDVEYRVVTTREAMFATQRLTATFTGAFDAQMGDSTTGTKWDDRLIRNANKFGSYGANHFPRTLKREHFINGGEEMTLRLHNRSAAPNRIQVMIEGRKVMGK